MKGGAPFEHAFVARSGSRPPFETVNACPDLGVLPRHRVVRDDSSSAQVAAMLELESNGGIIGGEFSRVDPLHRKVI